MKTKISILALTLALVIGMGFGINARAQNATTSITGVTTGTTASPGLPTTGAGGNAPINSLFLVASGVMVLGGVNYLNRARKMA